jgi:exosortase
MSDPIKSLPSRILSAISQNLSTKQKVWLVLLGAALFWAYAPVFATVVHRWIRDPQYSHGFLVPIFSLVILWHRRSMLDVGSFRSNAWGYPLLAVGLLFHLADGFLYVNWFDTISLLTTLFGLCLLMGGSPALAWAWPAIAFLFFMMPLPYRVETALALPMRRVATETSTYVLQTVGFPAVAEGTDILLNDQHLEVAPACSGLGMLLIFFTLSFAMVSIIDRDWIDKTVILVSAIPIAIVANIVRITLTAILYDLNSAAVARAVFHDGAGYLMMAVALGLLWLELKIMRNLFIADEGPRPLRFSYAGPQKAQASPKVVKP